MSYPPKASLVLGLALAAGCGTARSTAPSALAPGDHRFLLEVDGRQRSYLIHVPAVGEGPFPLLLAFHGGGGNAAQFQRVTAFDTHADGHGYLVAYLDGTGTGSNSWNAGGCCSTAQALGVDDVAFGRAVIEDVAARIPVARDRVYVTGHSNGAMMAHRFAAEASDVVAAAAPYAGSPYFGLLPFAPARRVPILHIHSMDDPLALFDGGVSGEGTYKTPVMEQLAQWAGRNGCGAPVVGGDSTIGAADGPNAGQSAAWVRWAGCPPDAPIVLRRLTGAGHAWPGLVLSPEQTASLGPATTLIDLEDEIWAFVSVQRR